VVVRRDHHLGHGRLAGGVGGASGTKGKGEGGGRATTGGGGVTRSRERTTDRA
jgi:hypothetical protein